MGSSSPHYSVVVCMCTTAVDSNFALQAMLSRERCFRKLRFICRVTNGVLFCSRKIVEFGKCGVF